MGQGGGGVHMYRRRTSDSTVVRKKEYFYFGRRCSPTTLLIYSITFTHVVLSVNYLVKYREGGLVSEYLFESYWVSLQNFKPMCLGVSLRWRLMSSIDARTWCRRDSDGAGFVSLWSFFVVVLKVFFCSRSQGIRFLLVGWVGTESSYLYKILFLYLFIRQKRWDWRFISTVVQDLWGCSGSKSQDLVTPWVNKSPPNRPKMEI